MTGTPSSRSIRRLRATGRMLFALGAALVLVATLAPLASAADNSSPSDDRATHSTGNFGNRARNCQTEYGVSGTQVNSANITVTVTSKDVSTTNDGVPVTYEGTQAVNVTATDVVVVAVIIKGGNGYNTYGSGVPDMINPLNNSGHPAGLSHWVVCYRNPVADPAIVKSGSAEPVQLGADHAFILSVSNEGEGGSSTGPFTVSDSVPTDAGTVVSVSDDSDAADCTNDGNDVSCTVDDLESGASFTVTVDVTAPSENESCGTVTNTASLDTDGQNSSTSNDSSSDDVTIAGCQTIVEEPNPSVDVEKLVSLNGGEHADADTAPGVELDLQLNDPSPVVEFLVVVTNTSGDGTVLVLDSLTDAVSAGDGDALDLTGCRFPEGGLPDGRSVECELGPFPAVEGVQHTNTVTVSATGAGETVGDSDPANYSIDRVGGVVIDRPDPDPAPRPDPAPDPDVLPEPEPAPEVIAEELPRTGPADLWLAGLALMLVGGGLRTLARARAMDRTAYVTGTWTSRMP